MRVWRFIVACLCLIVGLTACNLGTTPSNEAATPINNNNDVPPVATKPSVIILSPNTGEVYEVDEQIIVSVQATDTVGVTRIQLIVNGSIVKTVTSSSISGDPTFSAALDYVPRATGTLDIQVIASRGAVASDPANLRLEVVQDSAVIITPTGSGAGSGGSSTSGGTGADGRPTIPNDGVCRALTTANLNMRSQPTTTQENVIRVLPRYTLAPIVGRLGDNSWWQLSYGGSIGWVSASFTEIYGNCLTIPVQPGYNPIPPTTTPLPTWTPSRTPTWTPSPTVTPSWTPEPGRPDLVVTGISGDQSLIIPAGETSVTERYSVTITNIGNGPSPQFETRLYADGQEYDLGVVSDLPNGGSIVLVADVTFTAAGTFNVRVQVDPNNAVIEISDFNNRGDISVTVSQSQ